MRATDVLIPPRWSPPARPAVTQGLSTRAVAGMKDASGNIIRPNVDGGAVDAVILPPSLPQAPRIEDILVKASDGWLKGWSIAAEAIVADHISAGAIETTHLAAEAVTAEKIAAGAITTEKIDAGAITAEKIAAGAITAEMLDVEELSALSADLGTVTAGVLQNAAGDVTFDLGATGTDDVLRLGSTVSQAATFVHSANGYTRLGSGTSNRYVEFNPGGSLQLVGVSLVAPSGTLGQLEIASGGHIQSTDYVPGTSGWRLGQTSAELNDVTVRGTLDGATGTFAGALSAATGTFAGELSAATGTFAGELSAATGSFSGTLTAGTVEADVEVAANQFSADTAQFAGGIEVGTHIDVDGLRVEGGATAQLTHGGSIEIAADDSLFLTGSSGVRIDASSGSLQLIGNVAFFGALSGAGRQTVTGNKGSNLANVVASLLSALAAYNLILDATT